VGKSSLGVKVKCSSCEAKFYDLNKRSPICPKCGVVNDVPVKSKLPRGRLKTTESQKTAPPPIKQEQKTNGDEIEDIDELETSTKDEDDNLMEDTSDLGGSDDVDSVIGTINDANKET